MTIATMGWNIKNQYNSDVLNVALNIGLLTKDKPLFRSTKLGLSGTRTVVDDVQKFKLYDNKKKQVLFSLILQTNSPMKVVEFKRGIWEGIFDRYVKENSKGKNKEPKSTLRLRKRTKESKNRIKR